MQVDVEIKARYVDNWEVYDLASGGGGGGGRTKESAARCDLWTSWITKFFQKLISLPSRACGEWAIMIYAHTEY